MRLGCALACLILSLAGLCACAAGLPLRPPGQGPFAGPPAGAASQAGLALWWFLLAMAGLGLAWVFFRRGGKTRHPPGHGAGGKWTAQDMSRLEAALSLLNEIALAWRRRKSVVSLAEWLAKKIRNLGR